MNNKSIKILLWIIILITFIPDVIIYIDVFSDNFINIDVFEEIIEWLYMFRWIIRIICIVLLIIVSKKKEINVDDSTTEKQQEENNTENENIPKYNRLLQPINDNNSRNNIYKPEKKKNTLLTLSFIPLIVLIIVSIPYDGSSCFIFTCYDGLSAFVFNLFSYGVLGSPILALCLIYQVYKFATRKKNK